MSHSRLLVFAVALSLCAAGLFAAPAPQRKNAPHPTPVVAPASPVLLDVMQQELGRAMQSLAKQDPAPYFMSYAVTDHRSLAISAGQGALFGSETRRARTADISVRVAGPELDNTHGAENRTSGMMSTLLPLSDDPEAIARILWLTTDREYKRASRNFLQVKTNLQVRAREEDTSADFSKEDPQRRVVAIAAPARADAKLWEDRARRYSALFDGDGEIYRSMVQITYDEVTRYFVSSEGSRVVTQKPLARLIVIAETRADDGMELMRTETFDAPSLDRLPSEETIVPRLQKMADDLHKLRKAPAVEPFNGPALLSGRAAAVFFHEVLGHRVEGQRNRGVEEGQTFAKKLGEEVLPPFLTVVDDPTRKQLNGVDLNGAYEFDEEGMPAEPVDVVDHGVLKNFLMSRTPVKNFAQSNGHGRGQEGLMPVGRQGNLIVSSSSSIADSELRQALIDEVKRQNKPYGLYFEDIQGGFTLTARGMPQAFQVLPLVVWRVYPDGRPDELVRGVEIVGTPLAALTRIVKTGTAQQVFNGVCGAESGSVPVSAAAPAMLLSDIEVQKRRQTQERPPILPPPGVKTGGAVMSAGNGGGR
jgi:TldD protein